VGAKAAEFRTRLDEGTKAEDGESAQGSVR